jgi:type I restriction enzyme S subunit
MWVTPAELDGSKYFGKTQRTISDEAASKLQLLPIGTVLFSSRAPIGKVAITTAPMYCNQGFKNIVCGDSLYNEYVYWCLKYNVPILQAVGGGATFKELSKSAMSDFSIPIPPLSIQYSIVRELDLLHSMIEKKKEQLYELDNLAQSLFYQMFGDPITNPMGWEIKKLGEVCVFSQGMQAPIEEQYEECREGLVRFLRIIDFTQGTDAPRYVECKDDKYILHDKEIAIVRYGTPGFVCYGKYGAIANNLFKITPVVEGQLNYSYFIHWLSSDAFQMVVKGNQYGAALQAIKFSTIQNILTILPPLSLQQSFAAKVSAIEAQKQAITQSIQHTEALLAQRMDNYFGI